MVGVIGIAATAGLGYGAGDHFSHFGHSMLVATMFFLSICLGALFFTLLQHVTSAGWSVVVRRVAESMTGALMFLFPIVLLLIGVPALMKNGFLYDWMAVDAEWVQNNTFIQAKKGYLNGPFLFVRILIYFAVWIGVALLHGPVPGQDDDQDPGRTLKMQPRRHLHHPLRPRDDLAAFDFLMSLNAEWFSTMYGVYFFAGAFWSSLATLALSTMWLEKRGELKGVVTSEHYHDIGKLMFAFTFFWSYVAFSQFMLYWYADIPEETHWFNYRMWGDWTGFSMLLLVGHFAIPMLGLLSRHVKRNRKVLAFWCFYVLTFHFIDLYWNVMPELANGLPGGDPAQPAFRSAPWICRDARRRRHLPLRLLKTLDGKPALAIGDPRLPESMAFQNI